MSFPKDANHGPPSQGPPSQGPPSQGPPSRGPPSQGPPSQGPSSLIMPLIIASPVDIGPRKRRRLNPEAQQPSMNPSTPVNYRIPGSNAAGTSVGYWGSTMAQNKATELGAAGETGEQKLEDNFEGSSQEVRRN
jgi:hypothetical protein